MCSQIGCDRSAKLIRECYEKHCDALITDCLRLPFRSDSIDYCTCIAVLHHLCTKSRRAEAIREIGRVLRPRGRALIYVWAKNQRQNKCMSSYLKQRNRSRKHVEEEPVEDDVHSIPIPSLNGSHDAEERISLPVHVNRTDFKYDDMLVPWKMKSTNENAEINTYLRYYHVFEDGELESLCDDIEEIKVIRNYYDQGNWCVIFEKHDYKSKSTTIQPSINV